MTRVSPPRPPRVYVLLVNWRGWQDTLACLESVFRSDYPNLTAVVCDNGSGDGSLDRMQAWARGELPAPAPPATVPVTSPPVPKPVGHRVYTRLQAEAQPAGAEAPLVLIDAEANLGFAGGNNAGLRYILGQPEAAWVWLLNNDTVVAPTALGHLLAAAEASERIGAVGATVLYADAPGVINAAGGGRIRRLLGLTRLNRESRSLQEAAPASQPLDYLYGASFFVKVSAVREIGLLDETFFHFWEDVDWSVRLVQAGYALAYAPQSRVYHKRGASIPFRSPQADYYELRNGLWFYRKHLPFPLLMVHVVKFLAAGFNRLRRRQPERLPLLCRALYHGLTTPLHPSWQMVEQGLSGRGAGARGPCPLPETPPPTPTIGIGPRAGGK